MSEQKVCPTCGTEYPMSERFCPRDGSALRSQNKQNDLVGMVIADRYHVIKKLGEGGMGAVYLAEHVKMGRKSAIKVMNPGTHQDADAIARFNREASNASRLNHPNICAIYDFGETPEGLIYLAMEYIEGMSLTALIEEHGALAPARAANIVHQAADALQVAHDYGIVHRDLKPDNIMITKDRNGADVAKVVDFGIAKASSSDAQKVTKTGLVVGTPEYMSPEQLAGDKLDGRSDIYSLALVAFNCFTGTLPFPSNSAQEAMIMRLTDQPKTLADMKPDMAWPAELQAVMDRALARDAVHRTASAAEFGRDLSKAVEGMPTAAVSAELGTMVISAQTAPAGGAIPATRVAGKAERTPSASAPTVAQGAIALPVPAAGAAPVAHEEEPARKGGMGMFGAVVGGIAVVAGGAYFALSGGKAKDTPLTALRGSGQTTQTAQSTQTAVPTGGSVTPGSTTPGGRSPRDTNPGGTRTMTKQRLPNPGPGTPGTSPAPTGGGAVNVGAELDRLRAIIEDKAEAGVPEVLQGLDRLAPSIKLPADRVHAAMIRGNAKALGGDFEAACKLFKGVSAEAQKTKFKVDLAKLMESCS